MVKRIGTLLIAALCASCETYDFGGMLAAGSSVEERYENSVALPDRDSHPASVLTPANSYRFVVASDLHLKDSDFPKFDRFLATAADGSLLTLLLGDLKYEAGSSLERLAASFEPYENMAVMTAIGNHEVYKKGYQHEYRPVFGATCYSFRAGTFGNSDLFIVLDSANGTLGRGQFAWLESLLLYERGSARHCFIFTHANFFSPPGYMDVISSYPVEEMMKLLDLFSRNRVTAVFSGHTHVRDQTTVKGVKYITTGSWTDSGKHKGEYCHIDCAADGTLDIGFTKVE